MASATMREGGRERVSSFGLGPPAPGTPERGTGEGRVYASQSLVNKNVNWMSSTSFWFAYVMAIVIFRGLLYALLPKPYFSPEVEWTLTTVAHGVVSFVGLHWNRGSVRRALVLSCAAEPRACAEGGRRSGTVPSAQPSLCRGCSSARALSKLLRCSPSHTCAFSLSLSSFPVPPPPLPPRAAHLGRPGRAREPHRVGAD